MSGQLKLGPARDFERDWIVDLWAEQFGAYGHEEDMVDDALDSSVGGICAYTIGSQDSLYAFSLLTTFPIEAFDDEYAIADTTEWPKATRNGCIYMVCVADHAKNHGYAKTLLRRSYDYFWRNDIKRIYATSWHRESAVDSRLLFKSLGYDKLTEVEGYYQADEGDPERDCPDCGVGCTCTATHWTTAIEETDVDQP